MSVGAISPSVGASATVAVGAGTVGVAGSAVGGAKVGGTLVGGGAAIGVGIVSGVFGAGPQLASRASTSA